MSTPLLDPGIFRAYDIRGIVDENLGPSVVRQIGRAFCAEALALGQHRVGDRPGTGVIRGRHCNKH